LSGRPTKCRYCRYPATKGRCYGNHFSLYIWGVHWRHLANKTELSVCGSDVALCQITLTTCFFLTYICLLIYFLIYIFGFSLRTRPRPLCFQAGGRKRHFSWQLHSASPQNVACENMVTFRSFDRPGRLAEPMQLKFVMGEYAVGLLVHAIFGRISEWMGAGTHKTSTLGQILHFSLSQFKI